MISLLKKILSKNGKKRIKSLLEKVDFWIASKCSNTRITSSIYYLIFNSAFRREHQSVLKGRVCYAKSLLENEGGGALLRRNIHRLEKGIIMRPRRDVFGTAFIEETVDAFIQGVGNNKSDYSELCWGMDVLIEYFSIVGSSPEIERAKQTFLTATPMVDRISTQKNIPYQHKDIVQSRLSLNELESLFKQRRSVRWYLDQPVDLSLVKQAVDVATLAPSACNRQPFSFYTVTQKEKVKKVADCAMGTAGFSDNIPILIAVVGDLSAYPSERDRHVIYIDGGLISMQFMLALETQGLSSCPINWPDIEKRESMLDKELNLAEHQRTVMLLAVGYADPEGGIAFSQKKDSSILVKVIN